MYTTNTLLTLLLLSFHTLAHPTTQSGRYDYLKEVRCNRGPQITPTYGTGGKWIICSELLIHASVRKCYNALIDFPSYYKWNTFVPGVTFPNDTVTGPRDVYVGQHLVLAVAGLLPGNVTAPSPEVITLLEPGRGRKPGFAAAAWKADSAVNGTFVTGEHPTVLTDVGGGYTRYVSYETYYGMAADVILPLQPVLQTLFEKQGAEFKAYVEGLKGKGKGWSSMVKS